MKLGVCYYPEQWDRAVWRHDAQAMVRMGISVVRIAEFAWSRMEPAPSRYDWEWLDEAIEVLAQEGLKIVLGTPTAAPPRWLIDAYPDVLAWDAQGRVKEFGSRRHYCFSSDSYVDASRRIVTAMAQRYGRHPSVVAWQTDNEYGCHDTVLSYSPSALRRFRAWLERRYGCIDALNQAWGTVFWSMEYASFDQIGFPVSMPAPPAPAHALDYRCFASSEVVRFNRMQCDILREHSSGRDLIHNFMGFFGEFDHYEVTKDLDVAAWDSYPLGFTDMTRFIPEQERLQWMRSGHPDIAAFHHDLYRGMCDGRWWIMEQQSGPVNWANANPVPLNGMVRAWTWEAFAHGAEVVSYFRWRQVPYAQEQMHSGLHRPDFRIDVGGKEVEEIARELATIGCIAGESKARVALVMNYPSKWMADIQPHSSEFDYFGIVFSYYSALRKLGLNIDVLSASADFSGYALVVVPMLAVIEEAFLAHLKKCGARVVFGPRSGSKKENFSLPDNLPPGPLGEVMPLRIARVESLRADAVTQVKRGSEIVGHARIWREFVEMTGDAEISAHFEEGYPAVVRRNWCSYHAGWFDADLLFALLQEEAQAAGLSVSELEGGLRLRRRGNVHFAVNFGPETVRLPLPDEATLLLGSLDLAPAGVAAWRCAESTNSATS